VEKPASNLLLTHTLLPPNRLDLQFQPYDEEKVTRARLRSFIYDLTPFPVFKSTIIQHPHLPQLSVFTPASLPVSDSFVQELWAIAEFLSHTVVVSHFHRNTTISTMKRNGFQTNLLPAFSLRVGRQIFVRDQQLPTNQWSVRLWVKEVLENKHSPHVIKEKLPENEETINGVYTVVTDSFSRMVLNDRVHDVVTLFYMDVEFCPPCQQLIQEFEVVAQKLSAHSDVLKFTKINAYLNPNVPGAFVQHYPTIKYYPISSKDIDVVYTGERTSKAIIDWINDEASFDLNPEDLEDDSQVIESETKTSLGVHDLE